jgi:hypothetical protein
MPCPFDDGRHFHAGEHRCPKLPIKARRSIEGAPQVRLPDDVSRQEAVAEDEEQIARTLEALGRKSERVAAYRQSANGRDRESFPPQVLTSLALIAALARF